MTAHQALDPDRQVAGLRSAARVIAGLLRAPVPAWWLLTVGAAMFLLVCTVALMCGATAE